MRYEPTFDALTVRLRALAERETGIVIDLGGGRKPVAAERVASLYVGVDPSCEELLASPVPYGEVYVSRAEDYIPSLDGRADLVISHQVFEHVEDFEASVVNVHRYLRPGGVFACQFSGRWALFAVVHRIVPKRLAAPLVSFAFNKTVSPFPAHYNACYPRAFLPLFEGWESVEVTKTYSAYAYLLRLPVIGRIYRWFETRVLSKYDNLASHYLVVAVKSSSVT